MITFLDTSVVLRVLLSHPNALEDWGTWQGAYSSELLRVEARRVLDRLRLEGDLDDESLAQASEELVRIERALGLVSLTPTVLERAAAPLPTVVKTLHAIHLVTAVLLRERRGLELTFATHDRQQRTAARALGFPCIG